MASLRDVMAADPVDIEPDATVSAAAASMVAHRVGSLLVRDGGTVVGIFTERDVLRAVGTEGDLMSTSVRDWMTREPTTAPATEDTDDALATMLDGGFRHLPVTDGDEVVGIVSLRGLLSAGVSAAAQPPREGEGDTTDTAPEASPSEVHERREQMFEATRRLQHCSRSPVVDADAWRGELDEVVDLLDEVVTAHITGTEASGGFFEDLVRESNGRLSPAVRRLRREHERSQQLLGALRQRIAASADPVELRRLADELFAQLEAHRHRGSDLLWQAFGVEIGGRG